MECALEIGDLLRPHRAGMARYTASLIEALLAQGRTVHGWARWRRLPGWPLKPRRVPVHFFGKSPPSRAPKLFHATACVFPDWKSPFEIATVHDLYPIREPNNLSRADVERLCAYALRADRVICVSNFTRDSVHRQLNIPEARTVAIPLAAAPHFVPASPAEKSRLRNKLELPTEFLLFVGRDRTNKNLDRLVEAYANSGLELPLCIAGSQSTSTRDRLAQLTRGRLVNGSIRWVGELSEADLPVLLSCASALCMPSTFEGFGLPVIEAMACGTPVLTSANCATEEAAGGHAVLIDPESVESIAAGLPEALSMNQVQRDAARAYATRRTWNDVANETWRVYEN